MIQVYSAAFKGSGIFSEETERERWVGGVQISGSAMTGGADILLEGALLERGIRVIGCIDGSAMIPGLIIDEDAVYDIGVGLIDAGDATAFSFGAIGYEFNVLNGG